MYISLHVLTKTMLYLLASNSLDLLKAPAAFGLVSFLLVEGVERFRIRRHLFVFSIAAPLAALLTYYLIVVVSYLHFSKDMVYLFS